MKDRETADKEDGSWPEGNAVLISNVSGDRVIILCTSESRVRYGGN